MRFGLLGCNINYSYSKMIHEYVFKYYNLKHTYDIFDVSMDNLDSFMNDLKEGIIKGVNVTIPYKEKVMKYLDYVDKSASILGNVNVVINNNGKLIGYNTDYIGFNYLLNYNNILPNSSDNIYILGTGGAAKTVYNVCKNYSDSVYMVSRSKHSDNIITYNELDDCDVDYLINATPCGDKNHLDDILVNDNVISKAKVVIDLIYNPKQTLLLKKAKSNYNGLVMLISQALEADKLFLDMKIDDLILVEKVGGLFE